MGIDVRCAGAGIAAEIAAQRRRLFCSLWGLFKTPQTAKKSRAESRYCSEKPGALAAPKNLIEN
jgi:hypothetical protein